MTASVPPRRPAAPLQRRTLPVLLAVGAALLAAGCGGSDADPPPGAASRATTPAATASAAAGTPGAAAIDGVETFPDLSTDHVDGRVDYPQRPPVGGPHASEWEPCRFSEEPVVDEQAVHSLEHGAVWLAFDPGLPSEDVERLRGFVEGGHVLVSPYPGVPAAVIASAWGLQLPLPSVADPRLAAFVDAYRAGPQAPEPGAPC